MALIVRLQQGSGAVWLPGLATEPIPGTISWPAGIALVDEGVVSTPAYSTVVGTTEPFVIYLEPVSPGVADYYLDLTGVGPPNPWPRAGVVRVAWRDRGETNITVLQTRGGMPGAA
jgi:hypothetical protein